LLESNVDVYYAKNIIVSKAFYFLFPFLNNWIVHEICLQGDVHWVLAFVLKVIGYIVALNLIILPILWFLEILYLLTLVLIYEALFISIVGVVQILGSYIYREDSIPYRYGFRLGWWDYRKFAKLNPEERNCCRKEGKILIMLGLILGLTTIIVRAFFVFTH